MSRREEREAAFRLLYEYTFFDKEDADSFLRRREEFDGEAFGNFTKELFVGCVGALSQIDESISKYAVGWKLSRMSRVTKSVLRLAVYETMFTDTPPKVLINEAVELAKKYGEDKADKFINGILNSFARDEGLLSDGAVKTDGENDEK